MSEPKVDKPTELYLSFKKDKNIVPEYIPDDRFLPLKLSLWFGKKYIDARLYINKPIYYWHFRYILIPDERKKEDLQFIIHCFKVHDAEPKDPIEYKYFLRLFKLYQTEINEVIVEILQYEKLDNTSPDHYIEAYRRRWLKRRKLDAEFTRLYHGIETYEEIRDMYDLVAGKLQRLMDRNRLQIKRVNKMVEKADKKAKKK